MVSQQQVQLRWNTHQSTLITVLEALLSTESLVDVTLAAEGQYIRAHKVILCACSPYFQELLSIHDDKHPIIFLQDVKYAELQALLSYMYRGEVNICQENLTALLRVAESLQIRGIFDSSSASGLPSMKDEEMNSIIDESLLRPLSNRSACTSTSSVTENTSIKNIPIKKEKLDDDDPVPPPPPTSQTTKQGKKTRTGRHTSITNQHNDNDSTKNCVVQPKPEAHQESNSKEESLDNDEDAKVDGDGGDGYENFSSNGKNRKRKRGSKRAKVEKKESSASSSLVDNFSHLDDSPFNLASYLPELNMHNNSQLYDLSNDESLLKYERDSPPPTTPPPDDDEQDEQSEQVFCCGKCGKQYTSNKSLWRHRKFACDGKQTFACQLCGKNFSRSDNLRRHAVVAHCIQ